jgi:hypothetical protein
MSFTLLAIPRVSLTIFSPAGVITQPFAVRSNKVFPIEFPNEQFADSRLID